MKILTFINRWVSLEALTNLSIASNSHVLDFFHIHAINFCNFQYLHYALYFNIEKKTDRNGDDLNFSICTQSMRI